MKRESKILVLAALIACGIMAVVDGVIRPGYAVKSAIKIALFLGIPLLAVFLSPRIHVSRIFRFQKKGFLTALLLGLGVYGVILGGYFLVRNFFDFSGIAGKLTQNAGVTRENFLYVSLYISFVNSLLEEFLFRGFAFLTLKKLSNRIFAYIFSALVFAAYHFGMFAGSYAPLIWVLAMAALFAAGCVLNYLNEKSGTIYPSWLVHMFANFGINTVGFLIFGMI